MAITHKQTLSILPSSGTNVTAFYQTNGAAVTSLTMRVLTT